MTRTFSIPGPAGPLEAAWTVPEADIRARAVLCHPHPLYGGSMHDGVLDCMARVLIERGVEVLRFNFRGVGGSAGQHSGSGGEVDDLLAVIAHVADHDPGADLLLGGYSFGAAVVWQSLEHVTPKRALLVAPPLGRLAFEGTSRGVRVDVFAGTRDAFVDAAALAAWRGVHVHRIDGADHFFSGRTAALEAALAEALVEAVR